jgi:RHS repeat-associated protein
LLTGLTDPSGNTVTLTRSSGQLTTITEIGGRSLTLGYVGGLVNTLSGPSGLIATFGYNAGRLASVAYADGSGYTYTYDGLTNQLLTVGDLTGRTLETHTYYGDGRAKTSQIAAGKELQTLVYTNPLRTTVTDALNNVTTYDFSMIWGSLHVTKITGPCASCGGGGETQEWTYDDRGRVLSYKDGEGNVRSYTYTTADGDLETETRSPEPGVTHLTRYEYQSDGRLFRRTDPNLKTTTWTLYVPAGPQTVTEKVSATENRVTGLVYWPQGQLHFLTDPRGKVWEFSFFPVGDLQSVKDPFGNTTSFEYDPMGRRTQTILPLTTPPTQPTVTTYNIRGQVRLITNPNASYTQFTYDKGGRRETVRDALAHVTTYGYDPYGRLETITYLGTNQVARFVYDDMSHLRSLTDGRLKTTQFVPDAYGRVETVTYADLRSEGFTYYLTGRVKTHTDRNGIVTTFTYDGLGRVKGKTYTTTAGATVMPPTTFRYDENGYIGSMTTAANDTDTLTWTYDLAKQMMSETSVRNQSTVSYTYDPAGNRKTLTVGSLDLIYDYNDAGRLSMIHRGANTFTFGYDEASRRRTLTYPNGAETTYTPDELSRLGEVKANVAASLIARAAYTYDDISNRRTKTTEAFAEVYTPDDWNRLAQVTRGGTPTEGYSYDAVGNRQIGGYSDTNRLENKGFTTFGYDENGNLSSKTVCGGPCDIPWYYAWNAENQLIGVGQEEPTMLQFSYDPLGRRVRTLMGAVTTTFVYDGEDILRQTRSNGAVVLGTLWYIHGPGIDEPLGQEDDTGLSYFHADGLGSIVKTTNSAGSVTSSRQYNSFGNLQLDASSGYAFTGREWDSEVGLYYYRARYYDPKLGRFLNEDPIGFEGGDVNLYAYVWNNPTNFIDPEGLAGLNISCGPEPQPPPPGAGTLSWFWFNLQHDSWLSCMNMTPIRAMLSLPTPAACLQAPVAGVITGFTKHGLNSAISHPGGGTSPAAMLRAVRNPAGGIPQAGGTIKYVGPDATVIVNQQGKVVTTWPTAASGARCAPCQ